MRRTGAGGSGCRPEAPHIGFLSDSTLPPLASQSFAFLAMVKLWHLQSFLPLQSWLALLQLPFPLQSFVPSQWTPFAAFALAAKATAGAIIVASAPAIATPFIAPFFMLRTSFWYSAFCQSHVRRPRRNGSSPSHAAGCRASSITPERGIVFRTNGTRNAPRQLRS